MQRGDREGGREGGREGQKDLSHALNLGFVLEGFGERDG